MNKKTEVKVMTPAEAISQCENEIQAALNKYGCALQVGGAPAKHVKPNDWRIRLAFWLMGDRVLFSARAIIALAPAPSTSPADTPAHSTGKI